MKPEELKHVKELLREATTQEEIAEISGIIEEAKGRLSSRERSLGFWEGKVSCWEMFRCPEEIRDQCPAFRSRGLPCWEIEGTYCKLFSYGVESGSTEICECCRVYKKWGQGEPAKIRLY